MGDVTALCDRVLLMHEGRLFHDGSLDALVARLCPFRDVRMELRRCIPSEALTPYGQLEEHSGHQARLRISRSQLTQQVSALLARFDIVDLEVSDPPIEELIGSLFERGQTTVATTEGQQ
jgi:ABC-2 type transport system ATP-binding protein